MSSVVITGCGSGLGRALYESASNKHVVFPHYRKGDSCDRDWETQSR